ncbi:hypothetical protein [Alteromonas sp. KUL49]|uniref:hypothetical protein n=1 Tax=Alteromonas sp. KUL49 TaxID=2480798 RepID=UPI00102EFBCF|nr:hypothetical protein [Alteromonas sp. KUL49]TAP40950.1 hypothetical protein EYS00_07540 [Alteromonas sp. KUL49]GEA11132.1 hypothetical protein KUL49_15070 [Alteromonas sp. KUL49]
MKSEAINRFVSNIERLLRGEKLDLYKGMVSSSFEYIAAEILTDQLQEGIWYDGVSGMIPSLTKHNQVRFVGEMYVCLNQEKFWQEPFLALVTDNRTHDQGINVYVKIGQLEGEKELLSMDWRYRNT